MQQASQATFRDRMDRARQEMKRSGLRAILLEGGPSMQQLAGVRWGRSERTFALVLPAEGEPAWVVPGFEVMRARELIGPAAEIRAWEEDESPFRKIAEVLRDRGVTAGRVGIDDALRFFIFDGIRKEAPRLEYVSASAILKASGVRP
jgi:Xaa-Pro dipeptidase